MNRGFSLLEIIFVTALLGMVWLFTLPPFGQFQKAARLNSGGQTLAGQLKTAQAAARSFHSREKVALVYTGSGWILQKTRTPASGPDILFPFSQLPENISLSSNFPGNAVIFTETGNPSRSGQITVGVSGYGKNRNIVISPVGRIRVTNAS